MIRRAKIVALETLASFGIEAKVLGRSTARA